METHVRNSGVEEERMKRRASSDEWTTSKKRVLSSPAGSPVAVNGTLDSMQVTALKDTTDGDEPSKEEDLEVGLLRCVY